MTDAKPYPKASQLARGERRYRRKVASARAWQRIDDAKRGPCRICDTHLPPIHLHHLVSRAALGDDVEDNIVPLCELCHAKVTLRWPAHLADLAESLTDTEYAYVVGKLGEGGMERLFGVTAR